MCEGVYLMSARIHPMGAAGVRALWGRERGYIQWVQGYILCGVGRGDTSNGCRGTSFVGRGVHLMGEEGAFNG